ncbi:MAG: tetratricopeptide repeat protein [Hyphomicrobiales bacterium]
MSTAAPNRRLAAIMVADVVGYSRMMEADEAGTLAVLKERRKGILEPIVKAHGGRVVKVMGDGVLVEFASAVNAVQGAIELQKQMTAANDGAEDAKRIVLRIGINLGDVIGEGSDIYGEGVNIAARLEALAEPGGICLSAKVYDEVRTKIDRTAEDMGEQQLKNISGPVKAFRIQSATIPFASVGGADTPSKPSIAVLPFLNMSGDPEQRYFSDGITEDIITELSRLQSLFVIARNSSFQYRDKALDMRQIGKELGAQYIVEGSIRKLGTRLRITAQLIEARTGNHLWSERYDRNVDDLFELQDEVTRTVVATLIGRVEDAEIKGTLRKHPASLAAYDNLLRGIEHLRAYGEGENRRARELFERAIALDPRFALAHAYFSLALLLEHGFALAPDAIKDRSVESARVAVSLDPRESRGHQFLGQAYLLRGEYDLALSHFERTAALNPNDANAAAHRGYALAIVGRAEEGVEVIRQAMRLNPLHPDWYWDNLAIAQYTAHHYEEALASYRLSGGRTAFWCIARMAACYAQLGQREAARERAAEVLRLKPDFHIMSLSLHHKNPVDAEHWIDGMRKAGLPE